MSKKEKKSNNLKMKKMKKNLVLMLSCLLHCIAKTKNERKKSGGFFIDGSGIMQLDVNIPEMLFKKLTFSAAIKVLNNIGNILLKLFNLLIMVTSDGLPRALKYSLGKITKKIGIKKLKKTSPELNSRMASYKEVIKIETGGKNRKLILNICLNQLQLAQTTREDQDHLSLVKRFKRRIAKLLAVPVTKNILQNVKQRSQVKGERDIVKSFGNLTLGF
jgi:hypothetical protein